MRFRILWLAMGLLAAAPTTAQVTLDQLDQAMEAEADTMDAFRIRLQDPNPVKARAAMRLLIAQGDAAQRRLAIAHGFQSTDSAIRLEAVRGILDAGPLLLFRWTPEDSSVTTTYRNVVKAFDGDFESGTVTRIPIKLSGFSEELGCWTLSNNERCWARFNSGELSIMLNRVWSQFELNTEGELVGQTVVGGLRVTAVADLTQ
ncbi:MAG: hypothetical protein AB8B71_12315 [Paracoccaceae bacterium]